MPKNERIVVSIPTTHCNWLGDIQKKKGITSIQDAIRDLIMTAYEKDQLKEGKQI